eukprot:2840887-Rhodomonas_salina.3
MDRASAWDCRGRRADEEAKGKKSVGESCFVAGTGALPARRAYKTFVLRYNHIPIPRREVVCGDFARVRESGHGCSVDAEREDARNGGV